MEEIDVTFKRAAIIWWAILWRAVLLAFVVALLTGFVVGIFSGILMVVTHVLPEDRDAYLGVLRIISALIGLCVGIYVHIRVTKYIIGKKNFNGFRIALVSTNQLRNPELKL